MSSNFVCSVCVTHLCEWCSLVCRVVRRMSTNYLMTSAPQCEIHLERSQRTDLFERTVITRLLFFIYLGTEYTPSIPPKPSRFYSTSSLISSRIINCIIQEPLICSELRRFATLDILRNKSFTSTSVFS